MNFQYQNYVMSSFLLFLDNKILTKGNAYTNFSGQLYPIPQVFSGIYVYSSPFNQWVSDFSVTGTQIPTGVFINGSPINIGQSGLIDINYNKGQVYFSNPVTGIITSNCSIKDLNLVIPSVSHIQMLFDTKLELRPKAGQLLTGLLNNELTFPAIFVRQYGSYQKPYAIGGQKKDVTQIAAYVFTNSQFLLDATCSMLNDLKYQYIPFLMDSEMPYNSYGGFRNGIPFNYTGITNNKLARGSGILIENVVITDFSRRIYSQIESLTPNCYFAIAEFTVFKDRITS